MYVSSVPSHPSRYLLSGGVGGGGERERVDPAVSHRLLLFYFLQLEGGSLTEGRVRFCVCSHYPACTYTPTRSHTRAGSPRRSLRYLRPYSFKESVLSNDTDFSRLSFLRSSLETYPGFPRMRILLHIGLHNTRISAGTEKLTYSMNVIVWLHLA